MAEQIFKQPQKRRREEPELPSDPYLKTPSGQRYEKSSSPVYDTDKTLGNIDDVLAGHESNKKDLAQREKEAAGDSKTKGAEKGEGKGATREEIGAQEQAGEKSFYNPEESSGKGSRGGRHAKKKGLSKRFGNRRKWVLLSTLLLGGIGAIAAMILNLGSLLLPNIAFNMDDNRLKRVTRNMMVSTDTIMKTKMALDSTGDERYRSILESYRDPNSGLISKLNKIRPNKVAEQLLLDAEFHYAERRIPGTPITRQKIDAVTYGDRSVFIPENRIPWSERVRHPVRYMNSLLDYRRNTRTLANNFLVEMDPNASRIKRLFQNVVIVGKASKAVRTHLDIKRWRWSKAEIEAANKEGFTREDARTKATQQTYAEVTNDGARPRRAARGDSAATEELEKQNACMADPQCAKEVTQSGDSLAPEVRDSMSRRFSPDAFRSIANKIGIISEFGYLLCLVYESSIGASQEIIDSNSAMAQANRATLTAAADQQVYTALNTGDSRVNPALTGGFNDQVNAFGGAARSNVLLRANGQPYDTNNTPSPQASGVGMFGTNSISFLPSAVQSVFRSAIGKGFCGIVGSTAGAISITFLELILTLVPGVGQALRGGGTVGAKLVAQQVAKQFGQVLKQQFSRRGVAEFIALESAAELTTVVARAIALQRMGAAFNGAAQGEDLINQADAGATVYAQDVDRMQNASRPLTTQEYNEVSTRDEGFRTAMMQSQGFSERYFALNNPQSLVNRVAVNLYSNLNLSTVSSLLQNSADVFNPTKLFAGLPFAVQSSASAQQYDQEYLESPILSKEYGVTQWGWPNDEENAYTNGDAYAPLYNEKVLEDSGRRAELEDKYGKCFSAIEGSMGTLLADEHIHRDKDANVVADKGKDCAPDKLGDSGPDNDGRVTFKDEEAELVFRLRISIRNNEAADQLLEIQDPTVGIGPQPPSEGEAEFILPMRPKDIEDLSVGISDYYNTCFSSDTSCSRGRHAGLDFSTGGRTSVPILAVATGKVTRSQCGGPAGCHMIIKVQGQELYYNYQHMQQLSPFDVGEDVNQGDEVGRVGLTGSSTGAHLHIGVATQDTTGSRSNHTDVENPACFLPREELAELPLSKPSPQTRQGVTASLFGGC